MLEPEKTGLARAVGHPPGVEEEATGEGDEDEDDGEVELELLVLIFVGKPGVGTHTHGTGWDAGGTHPHLCLRRGAPAPDTAACMAWASMRE